MAMNNQLLAVVQHIESERGVSREIVIQAIEQAISQSARRNHDVTNDLRVVIDRKDLSLHVYDTFVCTDDDRNKLPFDSVKYDIVRIAFDADTRSWGKIDTVYSATKLDSSATIPKISPDIRQGEKEYASLLQMPSHEAAPTQEQT